MELLTVWGLLVIAATNDSLDVGTMLASYEIAAPFAALCWWQMRQSQQKLDKAEEKIAELQMEAVTREKDFGARLAPLLYDGALLYQKGNEKVAQSLQRTDPTATVDLQELAGQVKLLLEKMGE